MLTDNMTRIPKTFTPYGDRIALQAIRQDQTKGGIQLPGTLKAANQPISLHAWVIAIGPECKQVKEGDIVVLPPEFAGQIANVGGHSYVVVRENLIFGVVLET